MSTERRLRVGILGQGSMGARHRRVLSAHPDIESIAIPARVERVKDLPGPVAASLREALPLDVLVIATDTGRHLADLANALELGVPVILVEKPAAATAVLAREVVTIGSRVFTACCLRFDAGLQLVREMLPRVGQIHAVDIECRSYLPAWRPERDHRSSYSASPEQGGVMRDLIHEIDYAIWLFGMPSTVAASLSAGAAIGIESDAVASLRWVAPGGAIVHIGLDYLTRTPRRGMRVHGANGSLVWDALARRVEFQGPGGSEVVDVGGSGDDMYESQACALIALAGGHADGRVATWQDGVSAVALVDAARRAAGSGQEVEVEPWTR